MRVARSVTFGTLRRPRLRSKLRPWGFDMSDPTTALHNRLAWRTAFLFCIVALCGGFFSIEQPGSSVMFHLHAFRSLVALGAVLTRFCCCSYGAPYRKAMQWLHNKPWVTELEGRCTCPPERPHFIIQGTFTKDSLKAFCNRCSPSYLAVFGRVPRPGESVARFSASYPRALMARMASGSAAAKSGATGVIPLSSRFATLKTLGFGTLGFTTLSPTLIVPELLEISSTILNGLESWRSVWSSVKSYGISLGRVVILTSSKPVPTEPG